MANGRTWSWKSCALESSFQQETVKERPRRDYYRTMNKPSKYYSNDERIDHLKKLFASEFENDNKEAFKLAWMWLKTDVFNKQDFELLVKTYASVRSY
jgi:hypothetical protein